MSIPCIPAPPHAPHHPPVAPRSTAARASSGQATIELVGVLPVLVLTCAAALQALLIGLTAIYAQASAAAAARDDSLEAAGLPVPTAWRRGASVDISGTRAKVTLQAPVVLPGVPARRLRVQAASGVEQ